MQIGDIYWARIPEPTGADIDWDHPTMILTLPQTQDLDEIIQVVGISTKFEQPPPENWIELPYGHHGSGVSTGLDRRAVLKCDWVVAIQQRSLRKKCGRVPGKHLYLAAPHIAAFVKARNDARQ